MTSPTPPAADGPVGRHSRLLHWLLLPVYLCHATLVWLVVLRPPIVYPGVELDASWKQLVGMDFHDAVAAGVDFVFTYGPLGYFLPAHPSYLPEMYWPRVWVDFVLKAIVVVAVMSPMLRMPRIWHRIVYLAAVLAMAPNADDAFVLMAITGATLSLVLAGSGLALVLPVVAFIALLGMGKFVYFMVGSGCVALLFAGTWRRNGIRRASLVPLGFLASFAIAWVAIGQSLANLPAFLEGSLEIASGYNESMRWVPIDGKRDYFGDTLVALASIVFTAAATALVCVRRPWRMQRWLAGCAAAAAVFMSWKSGFVRQDTGHSAIFFCCAALVPMWSWSLGETMRRSWLVDGLVLVASAIAFVGAFRLGGDYRPDNLVPWLRHQANTNLEFVSDPAAKQVQLDAAARQLALGHQLPQVRKVVGDAPTDQVPHDQGILFLNELDVRHRPVFQSYSAYTPYLQRLNADFYADPRRGPSFVLFRLDAIDGQFATVADSQIYRVLLRDFRPRLMEREYLLLERVGSRSTPGGEIERREVSKRTARLGEWVPLEPGPGLGELSVDLDFSTLGRLWSFAIRGPRLYLDVRLDDGQELLHFVTSRGSMKLPFLLDPVVRDTRSFAKLYSGGRKLPRAAAFRLRARDDQADLYRSDFEWTWWRGDLPPSIDEATERRLRLDYPMFDRAPHAIEPEQNFGFFHVGQALVKLAEAPSAMTFAELHGTIAVSGAFGVLQPAYEGEANTDGITFTIERVASDGGVETLFDRRLEPKQNEGDRGMQWFAFETRIDPGAVLVFRTLPGADSRWDWGYWTDLRFDDLASRASPDSLTVDTVEVRRAEGGVQRFRLDAGRAFANRAYKILGTTAGTTPGHAIGSVNVPINPSPYLQLTSPGLPNSAVFVGFSGRLDAEGRAEAALHVVRDAPFADGSVLHHAFVVTGDGGEVLMASNPVPLRLR